MCELATSDSGNEKAEGHSASAEHLFDFGQPLAPITAQIYATYTTTCTTTSIPTMSDDEMNIDEGRSRVPCHRSSQLMVSSRQRRNC